MNSVLERLIIWVEDNPIVFLVILAEVVLFFYIILQINEKRNNRELEKVKKHNAKIRDLEYRLSNPRFLMKKKSSPGRFMPYESEYHDLEQIEEGVSDIQVNLDVYAPLVTQKFLVNIGGGLTLGSGDDCEVVVADKDVATHHCMIFSDRKGLLLKRIDPDHATVLERGRKFHKLSEKTVRLRNDDRINMGGSVVVITMIQMV